MFRTLTTTLAFAATAATLAAQQPTAAEAQLREQLRDVALQLRAAQVEQANAQAQLAAEQAKTVGLEKEIDALNTRLTTLTQRASEDKTTAEQRISALTERLEQRDQRLAEFAEALEKWRAAQQLAARTAQQKEVERNTLAAEAARLRHTVADRERKNLALYNTALEILDRYENFALGRALGAREPFIQNTRVKVETQVEGYKDTIIDNRINATRNTNP